MDETNLLAPNERADLEEFIRANKEIVQMQVWITTLEGEAPEEVAYRAGAEWKLGDEKKDNGLLLLIAPTDRRMFMLTGRGIQGDLPDILAGRLVHDVIAPNFREGRYHQGIREALNQAVVLVNGGEPAKQLRENYDESSGSGGRLGNGLFVIFFIIFFIFMSIVNFFQRLMGGGRRRRGWGSGIFWVAAVVLAAAAAAVVAGVAAAAPLTAEARAAHGKYHS